MLSNKETIVAANIGYLQAEGQGRLPSEIAGFIKRGLSSADLYKSMATAAAWSEDESQGLSKYRDRRAAEIIGAVKLLRAFQKGYQPAPEELSEGTIDFNGILFEPNEYRNLPETFLIKYREALKTRFFSDFLYKDRKSTRLNSSHIQKSRMPSSA